MKDLTNAELRRYILNTPLVGQNAMRALFPGSNVYTLNFPIEGSILKTIIYILPAMNGKKKIKFAITASNEKDEMIRAVTPMEVYSVQKYIQNKDECLAWEYNPALDKQRAKAVSMYTGGLDMNNFVLHLYEYDMELPPFKEAYEKKMQKNKGVLFSRGTIGEWKFAHIQTNHPFPWMVLQAVAKREFGLKPVHVFFNGETKEHPKDFIIWCKPDVV